MSVAENQAWLVEKFSLIEDLHERLAAITANGRKWPAPTAEERIDANRVQGCVSAVWLVGSLEAGRCRFRVAADSAIVHGLAALLCELYDGESAGEVATVEPTLIEALGLDRQLSPTRLNGLAQIRRTIREFAEATAD